MQSSGYNIDAHLYIALMEVDVVMGGGITGGSRETGALLVAVALAAIVVWLLLPPLDGSGN